MPLPDQETANLLYGRILSQQNATASSVTLCYKPFFLGVSYLSFPRESANAKSKVKQKSSKAKTRGLGYNLCSQLLLGRRNACRGVEVKHFII